MPILYTVIARGSTILAKYYINVNFDDVVIEVLSKKSEDITKHSYKFLENIIHCLFENNISYICITDSNYNQSLSFQFLESMKNQFKMKYGILIQTALPYSMNSEFSKLMCSQMETYNSNKKLDEIEENINELTNEMKRNLDRAIKRSDELEEMENQSELLHEHSVQFAKNTKRIKKHMWFRNLKTTIWIGLGVTILLIIIISLLVWRFHKTQ